MEGVLGQKLFVTGWTVESNQAPREVEAVLVHLVEQIGMDTGGMEPQIWQFPLDGKGGSGVTAVQPLVESFNLGIKPVGAVIGDTWDDHNHTFFVIASCRPYDVRRIGDWLHTFVGRVISFGEFCLAGKG